VKTVVAAVRDTLPNLTFAVNSRTDLDLSVKNR